MNQNMDIVLIVEESYDLKFLIKGLVKYADNINTFRKKKFLLVALLQIS